MKARRAFKGSCRSPLSRVHDRLRCIGGIAFGGEQAASRGLSCTSSFSYVFYVLVVAGFFNTQQQAGQFPNGRLPVEQNFPAAHPHFTAKQPLNQLLLHSLLALADLER